MFSQMSCSVNALFGTRNQIVICFGTSELFCERKLWTSCLEFATKAKQFVRGTTNMWEPKLPLALYVRTYVCTYVRIRTVPEVILVPTCWLCQKQLSLLSWRILHNLAILREGCGNHMSCLCDNNHNVSSTEDCLHNHRNCADISVSLRLG